MEQVEIFVDDSLYLSGFKEAINDWLIEKGESIEITRVVQSSAAAGDDPCFQTTHAIYYKNKNQD